MKKLLISLVLMGLIAANAAEDKTYTILDEYDAYNNLMYLSVYEESGLKRANHTYGPRIIFTSIKEAKKANEVINKYCKGTKIVFTASYDFTCDEKYSFIKLLAESEVDAYITSRR
nr:MAG TPA: NADH-ubiquinone oxidoreductase chain 3 [Bacteriophage sp.]